jgi:hypothetical protein
LFLQRKPGFWSLKIDKYFSRLAGEEELLRWRTHNCFFFQVLRFSFL